jgi:tRNA A37 threonylcarbamoyladenosine modification protein TsaB
VVDGPPLAAVVGRVAVARARAGDAVDPAAVQPVYVRRPDAEIARDRNQPAPSANG